jgi:hypothetical protein
MKIVIPNRGPAKKLKQIGIRVTQQEYAFLSELAKQKQASRSFVAETLIRAAMNELKTKGRKPNKPKCLNQNSMS